MTGFLTDIQQENLQFFYSKLDELLSEPQNKYKFTIINDKKIEGTFGTFENAISYAVSKFQPYEFIIQQIILDTERIGFLYSAFTPV